MQTHACVDRVTVGKQEVWTRSGAQPAAPTSRSAQPQGPPESFPIMPLA